MCERKIVSPGTVNAYWVRFLGATFHVPISVTDSNLMVQVAAFDLIVPALAIFALHEATWLPSRRILLLLGDCQFNGYAFHGYRTARFRNNYVGLLKEP